MPFIVKAQDPIFTQSSFVLETVNPAFSGFEDNGRVHFGIMNRMQWPHENMEVNTLYAFATKSVDKGQDLGFGFGGNFMWHKEVFTNYQHSQLNVNYSHRVNLNGGWFFRPAVEVGFGTKSFDFNSLLLADQININTGVINPVSIDPDAILAGQNGSVEFWDISSGFIFEKDKIYDKDHTYWFGASLKHLNRPDVSFVPGESLPLNMLLSVHANYKFPFIRDTSIMLLANYMQQSKYNRLDVGGLFQANPLLIGITAATNPSRNTGNSHLLTSINAFLGLEYRYYRFGFSYDLNTSQIGRTNGVYELSITYLSPCSTCNTRDRTARKK